LVYWGYDIQASTQASINEYFRECSNENVIKLIEDEESRSRSKAGRVGAFTKDRKLTFNDLLVFIIRGGKKSLQRELDSFYKEVMQRRFAPDGPGVSWHCTAVSAYGPGS
jgi:hypothetical protein